MPDDYTCNQIQQAIDRASQLRRQDNPQAENARNLGREFPGFVRGTWIRILCEGLQLTEDVASTYYNNYIKDTSGVHNLANETFDASRSGTGRDTGFNPDPSQDPPSNLDRAVGVAREFLREGKRKSDIARDIREQFGDLSREEWFIVLKQGLGMGDAGANTYYYKYAIGPSAPTGNGKETEAERTDIDLKEELPTKLLRNALAVAAEAARVWFEDRTAPISKEGFEARGQLGDKGTGAVYAYFAADKTALYVGQTKGLVKARARAPTSDHYETKWWPEWEYMRFAQVPDETDQRILEHLLIIGYNAKENIRPAGKNPDEFLEYE